MPAARQCLSSVLAVGGRRLTILNNSGQSSPGYAFRNQYVGGSSPLTGTMKSTSYANPARIYKPV